MKLEDYATSTANWRKTVRLNTHRTYFVIISFILIYMALGLLIDVIIYSGKFPSASLSQILYSLVTLQLFPKATIIISIIAIIAVWVTFALNNKLMLLGTEYHEVTPETAKTAQETQLYNVIEEMKISSGLHFMPKVYIIEADYMNAFASGYNEKSAMVAITRGLMSKLNRAELQAVMAHELTHIRNMDIKLTLMAAVLTNIILIVIDLLFRVFIFGNVRSRNGERNGLFIIITILRIVLPILTFLLVLYLSRTREYMADAGSVELMRDNQPLGSALLKIYNDTVQNRDEYSSAYQQTPHEAIRREAYIFDPTQAGIFNIQSISDLFSTHPSIQRRLAALGFNVKLDD